jgi:hypothetical protein
MHNPFHFNARDERQFHMQMLAQHAALRLNAHESTRQDRTWFYFRRDACWSRTRRHFVEDRLQCALIGDRQRPEPVIHQLQKFHQVHADLPPFFSMTRGCVERMPRSRSSARERVGPRILHEDGFIRRAGVLHNLIV